MFSSCKVLLISSGQQISATHHYSNKRDGYAPIAHTTVTIAAIAAPAAAAAVAAGWKAVFVGSMWERVN